MAISATKRAEALLSEMQGIAGSFPGLRFENFDDIVSRCTTAMLKLEQPEVVDTSISLKIKKISILIMSVQLTDIAIFLNQKSIKSKCMLIQLESILTAT